MQELIMIGGFLCVAAVGFGAMDLLDQFFAKGGFSPYWSKWDQDTTNDKEVCKKGISIKQHK